MAYNTLFYKVLFVFLHRVFWWIPESRRCFPAETSILLRESNLNLFYSLIAHKRAIILFNNMYLNDMLITNLYVMRKDPFQWKK